MGRKTERAETISRRRSRREADRTRTAIILAVIGFAGLAAVLAVVAGVILWTLARERAEPGAPGGLAAAFGLDQPAAGAEGVRWNHEELANYLRSKGIDLHVEGGRVFGDIKYAYLAPPNDRGHQPAHPFQVVTPGGLKVWLCPTPAAAHDFVGALGEHGWQWGRFVLSAGEDGGPILARVKATLGG